MKVISIIPARGGSKGIRDKNVADVNKEAMIYYAIKASKESRIDETWVSTDSPMIASVAETYGAKVLQRPANISTDTSQSEEALLHFAKKVDFDILVFIQATSPLITSEHINGGLDLMEKDNYDSVFTAHEEHWIPRWTKEGEPVDWDTFKRPMRQEKDTQYVENGMFYITKKEHLLASKLRYSGNIGMLLIPQEDGYQIDTLDDLRLVTNLLRIRESDKNELGEIVEEDTNAT